MESFINRSKKGEFDMVKCGSLRNEDYCLCTVGVLSVDRNVACDNSDVDEVTSIDIPDFGQMCRVSWSHHFAIL